MSAKKNNSRGKWQTAAYHGPSANYNCDYCGKKLYVSRAAADEQAKQIRQRYRSEGPAMRPYRCPVEARWVGEERWHIGHNPYGQARGLY